MTVDTLRCPPPLPSIREIWGSVLGYGGLCEIPDCGRVWSLLRLTLLTPMKADEYPQVSLCRNGSEKLQPVVALVLERACEGPVVRPNNGRRRAVRLANLVWAARANGPLVIDAGQDPAPGRPRATPGDSVQVRVVADPATRQRVPRVEFRGWAVDLAGTTVVIPTQPVPAGGSVADLEVCLQAARPLLAQRRAAASRAARAVVDSAIASSRTVLVEVLQHARVIAARSRPWRRFDIYECTCEAWKADGLTVPHRRVREIKLGATREQVCSLYDSAIAATPGADRGSA